jgi:hypothetical protein
MSDTTPPVRPEEPTEAPDQAPVLEPGESDGASGADASSAPGLRPRKGGPETTA